jgi:hypothetical protein
MTSSVPNNSEFRFTGANPRPEYFDAEFFPTPRHIAMKMLAKLDPNAVYFLEPSAGAGDLASFIKNPDEDRYGSLRYQQQNRKLDVIEQSPDLLAVLSKKGYTIVGFDWLEYSGISYYDAIVMNPPFSSGAKHLLKAWDFLYHGEIVCLLNAETLRNAHTAERQRLLTIIAASGEVEYLGDCFATAARKTGVEVALVYIKKVAEDDRLNLWSTEQAEKEHNGELPDDNPLAIIDRLGNMEHYYNLAIEEMLKGLKMIRRAKIYMDALGVNKAAVRTEGDSYETILTTGLKDHNVARAEFIRKLRRDAWASVFQETKFRKWLDKKQTDEFLRDVEKSGNIPFTADNVKNTLENVFLQRRQLFEKSCANVFDELTRYYNGNTNHTEGWKTNDNFVVNEKLVFPWGCSFSYGSFSLSSYKGVISIYDDLDRCLSVLAGKDFDALHTIGKALQAEFNRMGHNPKGPFAAIESDFFQIRYFKKGTIHLKFKDRELWGRFNQAATAGKKWIGGNTKGGKEKTV